MIELKQQADPSGELHVFTQDRRVEIVRSADGKNFSVFVDKEMVCSFPVQTTMAEMRHKKVWVRVSRVRMAREARFYRVFVFQGSPEGQEEVWITIGCVEEGSEEPWARTAPILNEEPDCISRLFGKPVSAWRTHAVWLALMLLVLILIPFTILIGVGWVLSAAFFGTLGLLNKIKGLFRKGE